ncbi:MAG: AI-2E family transporter [Candidatus Latescibacteria bacterium]|nr:AI-2E family transporter [Candidatus Latescibacterota bacterium]
MSQNTPPPPSRTLSLTFLVLMMVGISAVFFTMVKIFLVPVMLAAVFAGLFQPLYRWLLSILRGRSSISSFLCCLILLVGLLVPSYLVANLVAQEAAVLYKRAEKWTVQLIEAPPATLTERVEEYAWILPFELDAIDWPKALSEGAQTAGGLLGSALNKTSQGTFQFLSSLFIAFFTMFYFFRDGDNLVAQLQRLSPLGDSYERTLIERFRSVSQATVKGTLLIGLLQGVLGGLLLWAFDFQSPILWGVVMVILSLIPMVGTWLVLYPAGIWQLATDHIFSGVVILLVCSLLISQIDNVLRPWLVGRETGMHNLLVFFSTVGGLSLFGVMGFILGPIIAALFLAILEFYRIEFKDQLDAKHDPQSLQ